MSLTVQDNILDQIIIKGEAAALVNAADSFGRGLARQRLTKTQIRNVFGEVRKIEANWAQPGANSRANFRRLLLLKPRMVYQAKREQATEPLMDVLGKAIDRVAQANDENEQHKRFKYFVEFFEAILAYHTAQEEEQKQQRRGGNY